MRCPDMENFFKTSKGLQDIIAKFSSDGQKQPADNEIIYHYTSWQELKGIIEGSSLWLTDFRYLNDPAEIKYSISCFGHMLFPNDEQERMNFFATQDNAIKQKPFYIISMCKHENYLPAWRWYGDDAAGFAIGFNRKKLEEYWFNMKSNKLKFQSVSDKVSYLAKDDEIYKEKEQWFESARAYYDTIKNDKDRAGEFFLAINSLLPLVKHPCYKEEIEVRIGCSNLCINGSPNEIGWDVLYRNRDKAQPFHKSIPYISRPINIDCIERIWVAPRANERHAQQELKQLFANVNGGHQIETFYSRLPYKNPEKFSD